MEVRCGCYNDLYPERRKSDEPVYVKGFDKASELERDSTQFYSGEGKTMKYKVIKMITLQAIYEAREIGCDGFVEEFNHFLRWCFSKWGLTMGFFGTVDFNAVEFEFENHPKWKSFLLENGFIEKVEDEMFYSVGDRFRHKGGNEYMLAFVSGSNMVQLLRIDGKGYYSTYPTSVGNVRKITKKEFVKIVEDDEGFFTKIEEGK